MTQRGFIAAIVAAVFATGVAATVLVAQDAPQGPTRGGMRIGPGFIGPGGLPGLRELDLTDAQKEQVKSISESHRAEFDQIAERTRTAQRALDTAAESGDENTVRARATDLAAAIGDGAILRAKVHSEIVAILTAEQQEKLKTFRAQMEQRRQEAGGRGGPRPRRR